ERRGDFVRERGRPPESHGPEERQGVAFLRFIVFLYQGVARWQTLSESRPRPLAKAIRHRRTQWTFAGRNNPPIVAPLGSNSIVDSLPTKVGAIIEQSLCRGTVRGLDHADNFDGLAREEVASEHARCRHSHATESRLPGRVASERARVQSRQCVP